MPWIEARLRGQKVLARANADGTLLEEGGRVEVRYKPNDGRAYRAGARNLQITGSGVLPDDTCGPAEAPPEKTDEEKAKAAAAKPAKKPAPATGPISKDAWIAYTDGACTGNPGPAGAGFIIVQPGGKMSEGFEDLGVGTNNIAELTAILRAAEAVPRNVEVVIHTDSQYAIGVLTKGWKAKANQELIARIKEALAALEKVRIVYVPGHAGVPLNERADELAREAIRTRSSQHIPAFA